MSPIKLSVCIPTFNRDVFLRRLLAHLRDDLDLQFPYEIIIADNASTDGTQAVAEEFIALGMPIRYYKRTVNDPWAALASAYLRARGEYALYLADDDLLIGEPLAAAVGYLDKNPDVSAVYAPWFLHDDIAGRDTAQFYHVDADTRFAQQSFAELFDFIFERHVFPEIGVYRTATLRSAYVPREFCFWAFSYLAHFLDVGAVTFLKQPFYRSVTRSTLAANREQAGLGEVLTAWDRYRGGLEYLLYYGAKRGRIAMTPEQHVKYEQMCKVFVLNRMIVAMRLWVGRKDFIKAYELYVRIMLGGLGNHDEMKAIRASLPLMVAVQTFARQVNAAVGIRRVILSKVVDVRSLSGLLYEVGLDPHIEVTAEPATHSPDHMEDTAVFTGQDADRRRFIELGYMPNLVFSEDDLTRELIV
jgi:glycosyltransferase involved in cell wall biosynthesis